MHNAVLLLGSNMGDRRLQLILAKEKIVECCGKIIRSSHNYETEAWGNTDQQAFINCAVEIETELNAYDLLTYLLEIETSMGRHRTEKWEPRLVDIDIIFYDDKVIHEKDLVIPHPFIEERMFTLLPMAEIIPGWVHPVTGKTVRQILEGCTDPLKVVVLDNG